MIYKFFRNLYIILIIILFIGINTTNSQAATDHIILLAVTETGTEMIGSTADIQLEIVPGNGRVFLDTFPLTKLDTQMSTRFAKEVACSYYNIDCEKFDFIYTVRANAPIIGGPSAGSAITILTAAMLLNKEIDDSVAITGTINSGGIIGQVAGVKEKIDAASKKNITTVIIPKGTRFFTKVNYTKNLTIDSNITIDLVEYGEGLGVKVIETSFLSEAMQSFTGIKPRRFDEEVIVSSNYNKTMKMVAYNLCNRTDMLQSNLVFIDSKNYENAINLSIRGKKAFNGGDYYSAASYCFGSNVALRYYYLNQTSPDTLNIKYRLLEEIDKFSLDFSEKELKTISDLQTSIIVNERIQEAIDILKKINESDDYSNTAYALERFYSAESWSKFYGTGTTELILDNKALEESCIKKLKEAEERYQYANILFPNYFDDTKEEINKAFEELEKGDYEMCLFKASKAKAQSNVFIGLIGNSEDNIDDLIESKHIAIKQIIIDQTKKEKFPILGYSYYEYSYSLKDHDKYSSLLYSEYALELSDLDIYFKNKDNSQIQFLPDNVLILFGGIIIGLIIGSFRRKRL